MARSRASQTRHNVEVRTIARRFERKGYEVEADVRGYEQPRTFNRYRPDVIAKKGSERKIVEVETEDSVDSARDQAQRRAFRQVAERSARTTFRRVIAD